MIRVLRVARRGAMKARVQAGAQLDSLVVSAPESLRRQLRRLSTSNGSESALASVRACSTIR